MNRRAIALAADSATTTTYYDRAAREWKTRYFKGANKIFNLSRVHPVGMMTFDSANTHGVPWELIAKAYRENLGDTAFDHLNKYALDMFKFIENNSDLFPADHVTERFMDRADQVATIILIIALGRDDYKKAKTIKAKKTAITKGTKVYHSKIKNSEIIGTLGKGDVDSAVEDFKQDLKERLENDDFFKPHQKYIDIGDLAELGIRGYFAKVIAGHETTGIVFAGYGVRDYFPTVKNYTSYGIALGRAIYNEENEWRVTQKDVSQIIPLAKTQMVRTFIYGISTDALVETEKSFYKALAQFVVELETKHGFPVGVDLEAEKGQAHDEFSNALLDKMIQTHSTPLRRVVGSLPVDELAELAETLVSIESLKERVTTNEEWVGGPIDVAVISKGDGFVWIKRKHYFHKDLNPRFFSRFNIG